MHRSQHLYETLIQPRFRIAGGPRTITASDAAALAQRLQEDAHDYFYSAAVSLASACLALREGSFTWAVVKLYYATYLAARSTLAINDICVVYEGKKRKYFTLRAQAGLAIEPLEQNTHAAVRGCFVKNLPSHEINTQQIAGQHAISWIKTQRERLNYGASRFGDPAVDRLFSRCVETDYRKMFSIYLADPLYAYDPDHAVVALPLRALQTTRDQFSKRLLRYTCRSEESRFLKALTKDRRGPIPDLVNLLCT